MHTSLSRQTRRWVFWSVAAIQAGLLLFFGLRIQGMKGLEPEPPPSSSAASKDSGRADLLRRENERLKADLRMVPELRTAVSRLQNEMEARRAGEAKWEAQSNLLQQAIDLEQKELRELAEWAKDRARMKQQEAAEAWLAEKAALGAQTPEEAQKEYQRLNEGFEQIIRGKKGWIEWWHAEKTAENRAANLAIMGEAQKNLEEGKEKLGKDSVLFEELLIPLTIDDLSNKILLRSVVPDGRGRSVTVYLDGRVNWEQTK